MLPGSRPAAALVAVGALLSLSAAPGTAAGPVAQATATGLVVTAGGTPTDSGTYAVTHDGDQERATGTNTPTAQLFNGQSFLRLGTLAQDAATEAVGDSGRSFACAGLAGDGATAVAVGDGDSCLTPGTDATINAGTLDLSTISIGRSDLLMGLDDDLREQLDPVLAPLLDGAEQALTTVLDAGELGLVLDLGAIQSRCTAGPSSASGDSTLTDVRLAVEGLGQRLDVVGLPADPPPNTKLLTDLDVVVTTIVDSLQTELETSLAGPLAGVADPLVGGLDQAEEALNDNVVSAVAEQLAPLEENLLEGTLNKQVRPSGDSIEVTALEVAVLPAARDFGVEALTVEVGRSTCGPSGRVARVPNPSPTPTPAPTPTPSVPTSIPSGLGDDAAGPTSDGSVNDRWAVLALGALAVAAGGAGLTAYRRAVRG